MNRRAVFFRWKPGTGQEYKRRHDDIWPEMMDVLTEAGFRNYSIWCHNDLLFAYYEVEDEARMKETLDSSDVYHRWRDYMEDVIYMEEGTRRKEWPMELMFLFKG